MTEQRMPVGVRFREAGKVYYFDAAGHDLTPGNYVVVETSHGVEIGRVVIAPEQVIRSDIKEALKPILRLATPDDLREASELRDRAAAQLREAKRRIAAQGLDMQLVSGEYNLDGTQLTFYFTAPERVDFRQVVRELSQAFGTRVQFLQVGDRDRAKITDGYDVCGQRLCCSSWQVAFPAVSIKMAKEQDLPLNPQKISGVCGRLYCCLTFEYEGYRELRGQLPKVGATVSTPAGVAKVRSVNVLKKTVSLWMEEQRQVLEMPAVDLQMQYGLTVRPMELVEEIEAPLMRSPEAAAAEVAPVERAAPEGVDAPGDAAEFADEMEDGAFEPEAPEPAAGGGVAATSAEGQRRRRGRRGGRRRRKPSQ